MKTTELYTAGINKHIIDGIRNGKPALCKVRGQRTDYIVWVIDRVNEYNYIGIEGIYTAAEPIQIEKRVKPLTEVLKWLAENGAERLPDGFKVNGHIFPDKQFDHCGTSNFERFHWPTDLIEEVELGRLP